MFVFGSTNQAKNMKILKNLLGTQIRNETRSTLPSAPPFLLYGNNLFMVYLFHFYKFIQKIFKKEDDILTNLMINTESFMLMKLSATLKPLTDSAFYL